MPYKKVDFLDGLSDWGSRLFDALIFLSDGISYKGAHSHFPGWMLNQRGVRLALLALSVVFAFAQAVVDNVNNTNLTPLAPPTMTKKPYCDQTGKMGMRPL
ncbi:hypothetical protein [Desulfocicer niacini]